ncbi:MAG: serine hydrolase domain-containing protein [Gemmatimonadota bacterium]
MSHIGPTASLAIAIALAAPAACQRPDSPQPVDHPVIESFASRVFELGLAPAMAVAVVQGDSIVYLDAFGLADIERGRPATIETGFYIASSTKPFVGLAASLLHARGEIDLDAAVTDYLPDAELPQDDGSPLSLRDLLTHTHGVSNDGPLTFRAAFSGAGERDEMIALIGEHGPAEAGRAFEYGNVGYNVASLALATALGETWKQTVGRDILEPVGMAATTPNVSTLDSASLAMPYAAEAEGFSRRHYAKTDANMHAAGGLVTTAADLARWLEVNMSGGTVDGRRVFPEEVLAEAHRPHATQDNAFDEFTREGYGLGWHVGHYKGERQLHHFGGFSGFHAHVSFMPERRIGVAVVTNESTVGSLLALLTARFAYDVLLDTPDLEAQADSLLERFGAQVEMMRGRIGEDRARRAARPAQPARPFGDYAGAYANAQWGTIVFALEGDGMVATMGPLRSGVEVLDISREALRVELTGRGSVASFVFGDAPRAEAVVVFGQRFERLP